ncbi:MAG: holo-ACP synthase [Turicibacter sp.]|nr:holo-ACP synthase [Turicibacter sp.]
MAIVGVGTDIVSLERIKEVKRRKAFAAKVLSARELEVYQGFSLELKQIEFLAGRWAVKEAIYKAIPDFCQGYAYNQFTILNGPDGKPHLMGPDYSGNLQLSISHEKNYAVAFVVVESFPATEPS